jgi:hypothetical protein
MRVHTKGKGPCPICGSADHTCKGEKDTVPTVREFQIGEVAGAMQTGVVYVPDLFSQGTVTRTRRQMKVAVEATDKALAKDSKETPTNEPHKQSRRVAGQGTRRKRRSSKQAGPDAGSGSDEAT